ncbi:unnamed protein product [Sphacelaria rigidula]
MAVTQPVGRRCYEENCGKYPSFGVEGTKTAIFCSKHAVDGMVDVKSKRCSQEGCRTYPAYGWKGSTKAEYCARHADKGMINVKSKMCLNEDCRTQASHGWAGSSPRAEFCAKHAELGMTNVIRKPCLHESCSTQPSHGLKGTRKPLFCSKHASEGMIDVVSRRCSHEGCLKSPSFGFRGATKAEFCATHAHRAMVDVKRRRCDRNGCSRKPSYGQKGSKRAEYCARHAQDDMVNVRKTKVVQTVGSPPVVVEKQSNERQVGQSLGAGSLGSGPDDGDSTGEAMGAGSGRNDGMGLFIHCDEPLSPSDVRSVDSLIRLASRAKKSLICPDSCSSGSPGGSGGNQNDHHVRAFTSPWPPLSSAESARSHSISGNGRPGVVIPLLHGDNIHGSAVFQQKLSMFRLQRLRSGTVTQVPEGQK